MVFRIVPQREHLAQATLDLGYLNMWLGAMIMVHIGVRMNYIVISMPLMVSGVLMPQQNQWIAAIYPISILIFPGQRKAFLLLLGSVSDVWIIQRGHHPYIYRGQPAVY